MIIFVDICFLLRVSMVAQTVKTLPAMPETWVQSLGREIPWRRKWLPTPVFLPEEFHGRVAWRATVPEVTRVRYNWATNTLPFLTELYIFHTLYLQVLHLWTLPTAVETIFFLNSRKFQKAMYLVTIYTEFTLRLGIKNSLEMI